MIVVVLGMHKSGTTLIARALHAGGITMLPATPVDDYPREKYEWPNFKNINHELLGSRPDDSLGIALDQPLRHTPEVEQRAAQLIFDTVCDHPDWGFKDPRTTLTFPFWHKLLLPLSYRLIAVWRDQREVSAHYRWQGDDPALAEAHWEHYNACLREHLRSAGRAIQLNFKGLFSGTTEWQRLEDFVGRALPDVRDPALYRFRY